MRARQQQVAAQYEPVGLVGIAFVKRDTRKPLALVALEEFPHRQRLRHREYDRTWCHRPGHRSFPQQHQVLHDQRLALCQLALLRAQLRHRRKFLPAEAAEPRTLGQPARHAGGDPDEGIKQPDEEFQPVGRGRRQ